MASDNMVVKPPVTTNSARNFDPEVAASDARGTHIVVHPRFPALVEAFLSHKRAHGSPCERALYATHAGFTWQNEVSRLLEKRPLVFMGATDHTLLRDGTVMRGDTTEEWDRNGTEEQSLNTYLTLDEYLSYDEIMLSSLLGVSGPSHFINEGSRFNCAKPGQPGTFQPRGIIVGLVGARFERQDRMDSVHILPPVEHSHQDPRLSKIFQHFFAAPRSPSQDFDANMYKARMRITVDILLLEANSHGAEAGKNAHTYVVGLGLGVWQHHPSQPTWYIDTFTSALRELSLPHIRTLEFAYIDVDPCCQDRVTQAAAKQNVKVVFSRRNPAEKLESDDLLVLSYAWDGNAFPGNEYWQGSLCGSGDPAAACMSTIGELHNPLVNKAFTKRITVVQKVE